MNMYETSGSSPSYADNEGPLEPRDASPIVDTKSVKLDQQLKEEAERYPLPGKSGVHGLSKRRHRPHRRERPDF